MSNGITNITIVHDQESAGTILELFDAPSSDAKGGIRALYDFLGAILAGSRNARVLRSVETQAASVVYSAGTVTITHANLTDGDSVTFAGLITITARNAPASSEEFLIGANATEDAANMAAAINASASMLISATSALGVVTCTSVLPGIFGWLLQYTTNDATAYGLVQPAVGSLERTPTVVYAAGLP